MQDVSNPAGSCLPVHVVISNYNYGRYLSDAIDSALVQDHPRTHVVVVDDGSTDDSRERLRGYEGRAQIILKENGGQASAMNAGLERCTEGIVIFLDSDDALLPHAASSAAAAFASHPEAARVHYRMAVVTAAGERTGKIKPPTGVPLPSGSLWLSELAFPFDLPWLPTSGNAFRLDALRRILPIPEGDYPILAADWYLVHLTTLLGYVQAIDEVGALYRVHGANGYEPSRERLDLEHIRDTVAYARRTTRALESLADDLGLSRPQNVLSLSDLANRLILLKLSGGHGATGDRISSLLADAVRACRRRFDVSIAMKLIFLVWFAASAIAPRPVARRLAELFLFPERRPRMSHVLRRFHRPRAAG